jgi:hypothetical protein
MVGNRHFATNCPAEPTTHDAIGRILPDPDYPGVGLDVRTYDVARIAAGQRHLPTAITLYRHYGGTWAAVCEHYGLISPGNALPACPHCATQMTVNRLSSHVAVCPHNPTVHAAVLAALTAGCAPGEGVGFSIYRDYREHQEPTLPNADILLGYAGSERWGDVLARFGLTPARRTVRRTTTGRTSRPADPLDSAAQAVVDEAAIRRWEARTLEHERYGGYGLTVCGERTLPDGRVAHLVR